MSSFKIDKSNSDKTIISFLKKNLNVPFNLIHNMIRSKEISVNNKKIRFYHHRIKENDVVDFVKKVQFKDKKNKELIHKIQEPQIKFFIIYEDNNILLVMKDHNIEIHNSNEDKKVFSLNNAVYYYLREEGNLEENFIPSSVHRLDKLTKGIVIYPKNFLVQKALHKEIKKKTSIIKTYLAVCENENNKKIKSGDIEGYILKDDKEKRMFFSENKENDNSKICSMNIKEILRTRKSSLMEINLNTGRKHQIRSYFSYEKIPVIGDSKYGSKVKLDNKIALFAYKIFFSNIEEDCLKYLTGKTFEIKKIKEQIIKEIKNDKKNF